MKLYKSFLLSLVLLLTGTGMPTAGQEVYYPDGLAWEQHPPGLHGFDTIRLNDAINFAMEHEYSGSKDLRVAILEGFAREPYHSIAGPVKRRGGPAGLIIHNGYIVARWGDVHRVDMTFSVTKSFLSTLTGLAIGQGLIHSVHDRLIDYIWDGTFDGAHNSTITWDHLLNQSSDWSGTLFGMHDWADRPPDSGGVDDWKFRDLKPPGTLYEYNDVRVNVLAFALLQVWRQPLPQVLKEKIMDPIGASTTWRWYGYENSWVHVDGLKVQSVSGGGHSGGGMFISTLDMARFGLLFLRQGKWGGRQLVPESWIQQAIAPSPVFHRYGYMWWLNSEPRRWDFAPESVFYAAGFGGNTIIVDRRNDLVVVTRWLEPSHLDGFMEIVMDALKKPSP